MFDNRTSGQPDGATCDPRELAPHPYALAQFPLGVEAADAELVESIAEVGVLRPLTVTGRDCASPPGTVLNGNRRRRSAVLAGCARVSVRILDGLSQFDEERIVLAENLGDQLGRRLAESERARLEHELSKRLSKGQGHRSDLTSAGTSGGGDSRDQVAVAVGQSRNSVADRRTIFFSPLSSPTLQHAVDAGKISRTRAATLVREAERLPTVAAKLQTGVAFETGDETIENARARVEHQLKALTGGTARRSKSVVAKAVDLDLTSCPATVSLAGRSIRVEHQGDRVHLADLGPVVEALSSVPFPWPEKPYLVPVTTRNWIHAVHHAVETFPDDLRSAIVIDDATVVPRQECSGCGGTRFYERDGACVGCVDQRGPTFITDLGEPRVRVPLAIKTQDSEIDLSVTYWRSIAMARSPWTQRDYACAYIGRACVPFSGGAPYYKSLAALDDAVTAELATALVSAHGLQRVDGRLQRADGSPVIWRRLIDWVSFATMPDF